MCVNIYGFEIHLGAEDKYEIYCPECYELTALCDGDTLLVLRQPDSVIAEIDGLPVECCACGGHLLHLGVAYHPASNVNHWGRKVDVTIIDTPPPSSVALVHIIAFTSNEPCPFASPAVVCPKCHLSTPEDVDLSDLTIVNIPSFDQYASELMCDGCGRERLDDAWVDASEAAWL